MFPSFLNYNLFGPFVLNGFNLFLMFALFVYIFFSTRDKRIIAILSRDLYLDLIANATVLAIIFARIVFVVSEYREMHSFWQIFSIWDGGLSSIGGFCGALLYVYYFCKKHNIDMLSLTDRCVIYIPLIQAIGRLGCFCVGCCFGKATQMPWGIIYTDANSLSPLFFKLHPTQIYSFIFWILGFIFLKILISKKFNKRGQVTFIYINLFAIERFLVDFFRADVEIFIGFLGIYQFLSLSIIFISLFIFSCLKSDIK